MENSIQFLEKLPRGLQAPNASLFYNQKYLLMFGNNLRSFFAVDHHSRQVIIAIHFEISENSAVSLTHAPFGGIHTVGSIDSNTLNEFVRFVVTSLHKDQVTNIIIKEAPCFHKNAIQTVGLFTTNGFSLALAEINHHLIIDAVGLSAVMSTMQKRRLKKGIDAGFEVRHESMAYLKKNYEFIKKCRKDRNHSISITYKQLNDAVHLVPDSYHLFGCYDKERLIAATICVVVNSKVIYNYLPASDPAYDKYSPMVLLINSVYQYCRDHSFEILDLGTSMLKNKPNPGLITFKERLGGIASNRHIYRLESTEQLRTPK